jgi:hypothetical protein
MQIKSSYNKLDQDETLDKHGIRIYAIRNPTEEERNNNEGPTSTSSIHGDIQTNIILDTARQNARIIQLDYSSLPANKNYENIFMTLPKRSMVISSQSSRNNIANH